MIVKTALGVGLGIVIAGVIITVFRIIVTVINIIIKIKKGEL